MLPARCGKGIQVTEPLELMARHHRREAQCSGARRPRRAGHQLGDAARARLRSRRCGRRCPGTPVVDEQAVRDELRQKPAWSGLAERAATASDVLGDQERLALVSWMRSLATISARGHRVAQVPPDAERRVVLEAHDPAHLERALADARRLLGGGDLQVVEAQRRTPSSRGARARAPPTRRRNRPGRRRPRRAAAELAHHVRQPQRGRERLARLAAWRRRARRRARDRRRRSRCRASRCDQRMCDTGTIVWRRPGNGVGRTCSGRIRARITKPGEHVPRIPSGSQLPVCSSSIWSACASTSTWSLPSASGARRRRHEEVVGIGAIAHRGRLLLERAQLALGRRHGGNRAPHVAAGPDLRGDRGDQPLVSSETCR